MTDNQWQNIDKQLMRPFGNVKLRVDGYNIKLALLPISRFALGIIVYVNGEIYFNNDGEEDILKRFYQVKKSKAISTQRLNKMPKKERERAERMNKTFISYYPYWQNFSAMKRHFIKNNQVIQLVEQTGGQNEQKTH